MIQFAKFNCGRPFRPWIHYILSLLIAFRFFSLLLLHSQQFFLCLLLCFLFCSLLLFLNVPIERKCLLLFMFNRMVFGWVDNHLPVIICVVYLPFLFLVPPSIAALFVAYHLASSFSRPQQPKMEWTISFMSSQWFGKKILKFEITWAFFRISSTLCDLERTGFCAVCA